MKSTRSGQQNPAKRLKIKKRNLVAMDMHTNGLYRPKVIEGIKSYKRNPKHKGIRYDN